jgi:PncC family amidohydrolase
MIRRLGAPLFTFNRNARNSSFVASVNSAAESVAATLKANGHTVAVAETSSGGDIAAALLRVPGASAYFGGGAVCYSSASKKTLLNLTEADLGVAKSATEDHAIILAVSMQKTLGTDWAIGETGVCGPTGNSRGDPPGHCCIGIVGPGGIVAASTITTHSSDRAENMHLFAAAALELLEAQLLCPIELERE